MEQVAEYLKQAHECLAIAAKATNRKTRSEFEELAKQWTLLAAERQKFLDHGRN